jgi:hypothetical protein
VPSHTFSRETRERAAVFCSILACDRAANDWRLRLLWRPAQVRGGKALTGVLQRETSGRWRPPTLAQLVAFRAWTKATRTWPGWTIAERWAEAEALLRSYEIR